MLVNMLKISLVLGDASESVEARGGTASVVTDKANVTVNLKKTGKKMASPYDSDGVPESGK